MKTYCKNVDISNRELISKCVYECLRGKYTRGDVLEILARNAGRSKNALKNAIKSGCASVVTQAIEKVIDEIRIEIMQRNISLKPIWYSEKFDNSSHKLRRIGIQDIKQQFYDYIAVEGLKPILRRIGEYQCASIPGRGQKYGIHAIQKWLRNPAIRYAAKSDIQKCYESIDREKLMQFLRRYIRNEALLWLIERLIYTFEKGLSIGSYLSQYLCNLYLSQLYHYAQEYMYKIRRHKNGTQSRVRLVQHVLFYMDDILLLGTNAKDLHEAVRLMKLKANDMWLTIKKKWIVFSLENTFVDMMGVRMFRKYATIRDYVFLRIRRAYKSALRRIRTRRSVPLPLARRCVSYNGILAQTNSFELRKRLRAALVMKICKGVISRESKILAAATAARFATD